MTTTRRTPLTASRILARRCMAALPPRFEAQPTPRALHPHPTALAQRWLPTRGFQVIKHPALAQAGDILHRDRQLDQLDRNTRLFLSDQPANHALLWGARGTGKSSLVRAMLHRYGGENLGMIELDRGALADLADLIQRLAECDRHYLLFIDDLSFEEHDSSYKPLKALLDGSLMAPTRNILVYATSNRRHLLPEHMQDNLAARVVDGELHEGDALDEKNSLSERFGLWLAFHPFDQDEYLEIVRAQLEAHPLLRTQINVPQEHTPNEAIEWRAEALRFARLRGSRSGRVAHQFVHHWQALHLPPARPDLI